MKTEIQFLGYRVNRNGITVGDHHEEAIKNYPRPLDVKGVQRFVGLVSYFGKFILKIKDYVAPSQLMLKDKKFRWLEEQEQAFENLRNKLIEKPILRFFSNNAETTLHTDASSGGFGAILFQKDKEDGK